MGWHQGAGLGINEQGMAKPVMVPNSEVAQTTLSVDFHTNSKLQRKVKAAADKLLKGKKKKMEKMLRRKLLNMSTVDGIYKSGDRVGEFGFINSLFTSTEDNPK